MKVDKIKVLIVDDSYLIRQSLKKLLPVCGNIEIIGECQDGSEVLEFLYNHWVDTIILDYHMPKMNGKETAQLVKEYFNHIQIILHTSDEDVAPMVENVDEIIMKPAKFYQLANLIEKHPLLSTR